MSDEIKRLQTLLKSADPKPDPAKKMTAIDAAMKNFDILHQETADETRPTEDKPKNTAPLWKRISAMTHVLSSKTFLAGSASLAVIAIAMVVAPPVLKDVLLPLDERDPSEVRLGLDHSSNEPAAPTPTTEAEDLSLAEAPAELATPAPPKSDPAFQSQKRVGTAIRQGPTQNRLRLVPGTLGGTSGWAVGQNFATESLTATQGARRAPADALPRPIVTESASRDQFPQAEENPLKRVNEDPVSTFSVDVDTASYTFLRSSILRGVIPPSDAVRIEELINYFDYDYAPPIDGETPFATHVSLVETPWNKDTKLLHIGIQGEKTDFQSLPPQNLVFLIDTSGSMQAENKLPLLQQSFRLLLSSLRPEDEVAIVTYAGSAGVLLPPTKVADKGEILQKLQALTAGGSTAGQAGLREAYRLAEQMAADGESARVILATDGDFNVGLSDTREMERFIEDKRKTGASLSVLGFGTGNYNDALMQSLAQNGNGVAAYIDTLAEARKVLVDQIVGNLVTIAKDVKIQVEFNPATVAEYRLIGYETRALKREDFNNDKVDAGDIGGGHNVTALYEITPVGSPAIKTSELRYSTAQEAETNTSGESDEYAFVKLRYKKPDATESVLLETPVTPGTANINSNETRFAAAVAAFGQYLKGSAYIEDFSLTEIEALAEAARGPDRNGYRAEFLTILKLAETARR
ncbi:MAG: VWA domain-containing protein [Pseudomonadota bacterium]